MSCPCGTCTPARECQPCRDSRMNRRLAAAMTEAQEIQISPQRLDPGEMVEATVVEGDYLLRQLICPNCTEPFVAGQRMFQSADFAVAIHSSCVMDLAAQARVSRAEFEARRAQIALHQSLLVE